MTDVFDPYYKWLGIPPKDQPANHYRLLGIEKFESDTEVISLATDQRMSFLRTFQTGEHSESSQQLLNEVTAAKLCLLNSDEKARYDATLRTEATAEDGGEPPGLEATTAWSPEELSVRKKADNIPPLITDATEPAAKPDRQKIRKRSIILIVLGIATTVLLLLLLLIAGEDREDKQSDSLVQRDASVEEARGGNREAEQQASLEAKEAAKEEAERKAEEQSRQREKEEADRKAKEEADRKAKEEADRKAKEEGDRKAKEQAERDAKEEEARKAKEEADRKEQQRPTLKQQAEARRQAKDEEARREKDRREKKEAWRKDHPEEYLQKFGLVKKGNAWQLKDAIELKDHTEELSKDRVSLKKDLDRAKERMRDITARYKKLEQMLMVTLAKLKQTRPKDEGEAKTLVIWVGLLENPDFREDMITDDFPSKKDLLPWLKWYAKEGPQTRDRLIEFLNKHGNSFEPAQQQYLQSIQQLEDRKKGLVTDYNDLRDSAKEVDQLKQTVKEQWAAVGEEMDHVAEARGSAPIKPIKTTIKKADERVAAVLKLKEEIENFLKPPDRDQRGPPPRRSGGNRPR